jgi:hypothetical protein
MRMLQGDNGEAQRQYVDSLRWRRKDLQGRLEAIAPQIASLTRDETELRQQLRAVEQLLSVEDGQADTRPTPAELGTGQPDAPISLGGGELEAENGSLDFRAWGPKSRGIYEAAAQVIREAGVPLHYRVLAEEVQKKVPLSGVDPGATLIAHFHRAQEAFPRVGRGVYGLKGMVADIEPLPKSAGAPVRRRRKTRRRTR